MENTPQPVINEPQKPKRSVGIALFFALISLIAIIAVVLLVLFLHNESKSMHARLENLEKKLTQNQQLLETMQVSVQTLEAPQAKLASALNEAEYLVQLANYNLHFQGDTSIAVNLLKTADQQLSAVNDARVNVIRQTLANNMLALQVVPKIDMAGLISQLNAIMQQVPRLPLVPNQLQIPSKVAAKAPAPQPEASWQRGLDSIGHALKQVVVVQRLNQPIAPLLAPQQQAYLIQNIQLQLSQAQWALLHQQPTIFQQSLQQAATWVTQYFVPTAQATQSVLSALAELQKLDIKPQLPDLSATLQQIRDQLSQPINPVPAVTPSVKR